MKSEIEKLKSEIEKFQILQNCIIETQYVLREQLLNAVNEALEKIWEVLYPYSDYTNVRIMPSEEKDDYELVFKTKSGYVKVDGIASGGERALACLALRIALAMVLTPKLSWLILDEPTHNLDEEGIKMLAVALHDHVPKLVEQIFLITHDENLKDAVSGKFIVVERNKTIPEISNVEEIYY
jgi:DNA repair exonuclease SbcCD ATPase subunit